MMDFEGVKNRGLGRIRPYVGGESARDALERYRIEGAVKMSSNENPLGVSPRAAESVREEVGSANIYPEGTSRELREKLARKFRVEPGSVIVGNGADEIIYYAAMALVNDGDEVVIPRITFPIYEIAFNVMRARVVTSGMKNHRIDLDDMVARVTDRTKCVALCNPNNPTGHAYGRRDIREFVRRIPDRVLILMDEAYMDFADVDIPDTIELFRGGVRNLLILKTFSKAYGLAGFRVGFGIGDGGLIALMNRIKLPFNVGLLSQSAACAALEDGEFLEETLRNTREGREYLYGRLERLGLSFVRSSTNFLLIDTGIEAEKVTEELMKRGVVVRSAAGYGSPTSIRVTVGTPVQNERFTGVLEEVVREARR
jgi:histidinol-phosphate aminotransferase